ncbi:MAG: hypothetical protein HOM11_09225 [Methylococcales bacterium]|nr:hypothetical protein [Methylococcales bacterium]MBT7445173.1 hypothetical protein [Methylococcales bacterium]
MNHPFRSKLALQHAKITMLLALCLGLLISTSQIIYDAFDEQTQLKQDLSQALSMFESPLTRAILDVDEGLANAVLKGLFHHPAVESAAVIDQHKATIAQHQHPITTEYWFSAYLDLNPILFEHPIIDPESLQKIGILQLQASQLVLIDKLLHRAAIVFGSGFIRNTLLALLFLVAFYITLTLPLIKIIQRISQIDPSTAYNTRIEILDKNKHNEIGELIDTINHLLDKFDNTLQQRDQAERSLKNYQNHLELQVQKRTNELETANDELQSSFKKLITLEHEKGVSAERERIMRDMHDGVGGLLISTLSMVSCDHYSRADIEQAVRASMTDLRLIIDSLDSTADDLNSCLGMFRNRIEPQLEVQNIHFNWQVDQAGDNIHYSSDTRLQLVRILQEFVTNSMKHCKANTLNLSCNLQDSKIIVQISDNGVGFTADNDYDGRGLSNMSYRADKVQASYQLSSPYLVSGVEQHGTQLTLELAIPTA